MIYIVNVPFITRYTYWVDAENEKEAITKAACGDVLDGEETGEISGRAIWKEAVAHAEGGVE